MREAVSSKKGNTSERNLRSLAARDCHVTNLGFQIGKKRCPGGEERTSSRNVECRDCHGPIEIEPTDVNWNWSTAIHLRVGFGRTSLCWMFPRYQCRDDKGERKRDTYASLHASMPCTKTGVPGIYWPTCGWQHTANSDRQWLSYSSSLLRCVQLKKTMQGAGLTLDKLLLRLMRLCADSRKTMTLKN